jgi:hypothetical protein
MPTRKQRRRAQKERRHEYETVWVDAEGNELDEPAEEELVGTPARRDAPRSKPKAKATQQRGGRQIRVPPPPSWQRAAKRSLIFGALIFVFFYLASSKNGQHNLPSAVLFGATYMVLFIPILYMTDRFAYNRWQRRADAQAGSRAAKKR